jgi:hypothetical protein
MTWLQLHLLCSVILVMGYLLVAAISGVGRTVRLAATAIERALDDVKCQLEMLEHTLDRDSYSSDAPEPSQFDTSPPPEDEGEKPKW